VSLPLLADVNFDGDILRGLRRRQPALDILRTQDVGLAGADDPTVLEWAARHDRVLLTHDLKTMPGFVYERIRSARAVTGVVIVPQALSIGTAIEEILVVSEIVGIDELRDQVLYLPLR
jgi:hypothetical protein